MRFVPNANWNGTVSNGITFRAWDQTTGTAGSTADTTSQRRHDRILDRDGEREHHGQFGQRCAGGHQQDRSPRWRTARTRSPPADFGFTDPNDSPANTLTAVKITTIPARAA